MSAVAAGAVRWSCARCGVSVGRMDGEPTVQPESWTRSEGELYCLTCSRARAGDAAMCAVPETSSHEEKVKIRRSALIEFEIGRTPNAPDRAIAQACRTSTAAVAAIRNTLDRPVAPVPDAAAPNGA